MLSLFAHQALSNSIRYVETPVNGRTWVSFPACENCNQDVIWLNNHQFVEAFDRSYKKCSRFLGIKHHCRWIDRWAYEGFPAWLKQERIYISNAGSNVAKYFIIDTNDPTDQTDWYMIKDNRTYTRMFDNTKQEVGTRHSMIVFSTSTFNFTVYKSPLLGQDDEVIIENLYDGGSTRMIVNETFTKVTNWSNMRLIYKKGHEYGSDMVGVTFKRNIEYPFDGTQKEWITLMRDVESFPESYTAHKGENRIILARDKVMNIGYGGEGHASFIFPKTEGLMYDNMQNLSTINDNFKTISIVQKDEDEKEVVFYVTEVDSDCETVDYVFNGNGANAIYNYTNMQAEKTNCMILSSSKDMNYVFYASSDFNKNNTLAIRGFEGQPIENDIMHARIHEMRGTKNVFIKVRSLSRAGSFGLIHSEFSDESASSDLRGGYMFGKKPHVFNEMKEPPVIKILDAGVTKIKFEASQSAIVDYIEKDGFDNVAVFHQAQRFVNVKEFYVCREPLSLFPVERTSEVELTVHVGRAESSEYGKISAIVNGAGKSYMTNMKTGGDTECWVVSSLNQNKIAVFDYIESTYRILTLYNGFEMNESNIFNHESDLTTIDDANFAFVIVRKSIVQDCFVGILSITESGDFSNSAKGVFGSKDSITIFGNSLFHNSNEGYNTFEMQSNSLAIIKASSDEKTIVRFKDMKFATEINGEIEKNYVDKKCIFIINKENPITKISFFYASYPRDCATMNLIADRVGSQYYMLAEPNMKHCFISMSSVEHELIMFTNDRHAAKVHEVSNPTFMKKFIFNFDRQTHVKLGQNQINGKVYKNDNDQIYYENICMEETLGEYYIAKVGHNELNESHTAIIYMNNPGTKSIIQFVDGDVVYYNATHRVKQTFEYKNFIQIIAPEKKVEFFLFEFPDDCDYYDIVGNSINDQYLFNTNKDLNGKKFCIGAVTTFDSLIYTIHANMPPLRNEELRVFNSFEYGFNEVEVKDEFVNITATSIIVTYKSSLEKSIGVVGIYGIHQVTPECQCTCTIEGRYNSSLPHYFDEPSPHTVVVHGKIGYNVFNIKKIGNIFLYLPIVEGMNVFTTFLGKNTPVLESGTSLRHMIENVRSMMLHPSITSSKFEFIVTVADTDCDTIDNIVGQIGSEYMIVPEMSKHNKKHCIFAMSPWDLKYTVAKPLYSDEKDKIHVSTTFNMSKMEEVTSETSFKSKCIIVKIETDDSSNFTHCGISQIMSTSDIENSIQYIDGLLHMQSHNHLFNGPSNVRTLHRSVPGFNTINTSKTQITSINFIPVDNMINVIVFFDSSDYKLISGSLLVNSMHAPEYISVYSSRSILKYLHVVVEDYDSIEFIGNSKGEQLYFNTSLKISGRKVYIVAFGKSMMNYTVLDSRASENDVCMRVFDSFTVGQNETQITSIISNFTSQCIIIEYKPRIQTYVGAAGIYEIKKVGEASSEFSHEGIVPTTFTHYFSLLSDKLIVHFAQNGLNEISSPVMCKYLILFKRVNMKIFVLFNKIGTIMMSDHNAMKEIFESPREILVKSRTENSDATFFLVEIHRECTSLDFIFYEAGKKYMIDPLISQPNKVYCSIYISHELMKYTAFKNSLADQNDRIFVANSPTMSDLYEVSDEALISNTQYLLVKIVTDGESNFTHCGISKIESLSENPTTEGFVEGLFHVSTHPFAFDRPSLDRTLYHAIPGYNVINTSITEAVSIKIPFIDGYISRVAFYTPAIFTNEVTKTELPVWFENPEFVSVLANKKYMFEFTVAFIDTSCDFHLLLINEFFNKHFIDNTKADLGGKYCILVLGHDDITATYYKDPRTDDRNKFYVYNSHSMNDEKIELRNEFTTIEDFKANILVYEVSSEPTYGKIGIPRITSRYISGLFGGNDNSAVSGDLEASPTVREIVTAHFGHNIIRVSSSNPCAILFPSSNWARDNLRTIIVIPNANKFKDINGNTLKNVFEVIGSIVVLSRDGEQNLEFYVYESEFSQETTHQVCINCDKMQFLHDLKNRTEIKHHEVVMALSVDMDVSVYVPPHSENAVRVRKTSSFEYTETYDDVLVSTKLENIRFVRIFIDINDVFDGYVGLSRIRMSRVGDRLPEGHSIGMFKMQLYPNLFDYPTNIDISDNNFASTDYAKTVVTVNEENNAISVEANTLAVFPMMTADSPRIRAIANGVTTMITDRSVMFKEPTELRFDFRSVSADDDSTQSFPMNIFNMSEYSEECDSTIVSAGISNITICSEFSNERNCNMITENANICIFKSYISKYTYTNITTNIFENVKVYDPDGSLNKEFGGNSTIINSYFNALIRVPAKDKNFFVSIETNNDYEDEVVNAFTDEVNTTNYENQEIEDPEQTHTQTPTQESQQKTKSKSVGVAVGVSLPVVALAVIGAVFAFLYFKKKSDNSTDVVAKYGP